MKIKQAKRIQGRLLFRGNWIFLLLTLLVAFGLKYHYSQARSDDLVWILGPTAVLVEQLSGIDFEKEAHTGYVNNEHRVIIAPACAGVNFYIIAFCMAVFCGIPVMGPLRSKALWLATGLIAAYLLTLVVNALRIMVAIYLYDLDMYSAWITPERVHRLEGTLIYFFFLVLFYRIIKKGLHVYRRRALAAAGQKSRPRVFFKPGCAYRWALAGLVPLFWYCLMTLVVPLLNGAARGNGARFVEHSGMVVGGCLIVLAAVFLFQLGWSRLGNPLKRPADKKAYEKH
ncbi:MAG: exosortase K [Desulfobacterales bacterium]|jgi:exosortase K